MKSLPLLRALLAFAMFAVVSSAARAEDGYDLWLRYHPVEKQYLAGYRAAASVLVTTGSSPTIAAARDELVRGLSGLLNRKQAVDDTIRRGGTVLFGTPQHSPTIAALKLPLGGLGSEGYLIKSVAARGHKLIVIAANSDVGVLYGAFRFLSLIQTRRPLSHLDISDAPKVKLRMLNEWDNLDGTIERGYAGFSIFNWWTLPDWVDPRLVDYARANASIGINGVVVNNVGAQPEILTPYYIAKAAALANTFRPYGIKVYFSVRFSAPIEIGGLKTADPLDPQVEAWWKAKADEIYRAIPDFGGFLVKANSEGQPGPQDYGRTHADGANMLADALAPHHGVVLWRAFVYKDDGSDRIKQAYNEFQPLDGKFRDNVILQVKNGPLDFQPREPFSPLFGATPNTNLGLELQITKEYLGQATHLVYLGAEWQEVLETDTYAKGAGSTIGKVIDGELFGNRLTAMAGVSCVGTDRDWCGSPFNQANWYSFGRLAWDPTASSRAIAEDWAKMTFTDNPAFVTPVVDVMMASRKAVVDYMTPLGLTHMMGTGHHYGPAPWVNNLSRPDWNPAYYNRAAADGIGFDRSPAGSDAVAQYFPPLREEFGDPKTTPDIYLLWFHHLPWDTKLDTGHTLWDQIVIDYGRGIDTVKKMRANWAKLKPYVDGERFEKTAAFLGIQEREAGWWRDACIAYFQSLNKLPLPAGYAEPPQPLDYYENLQFPYAPGHIH
jgi:alpha-glucuronidase